MSGYLSRAYALKAEIDVIAARAPVLLREGKYPEILAGRERAEEILMELREIQLQQTQEIEAERAARTEKRRRWWRW